jgi:hypothetical protein
MTDLYMVFDVESVGLHGEGFAWGFVVVDREGREQGQSYFACHPDNANGSAEGRRWIAENLPPLVVSKTHSPKDVREIFWSHWLEWKAKGAVLAADCPWPVEARFLAACVDDAMPRYRGERPNDGPRGWEGPYPLIDVASVRLAAGLDPLGMINRRPYEVPMHDPLCDARQSARLLVEALRREPTHAHA